VCVTETPANDEHVPSDIDLGSGNTRPERVLESTAVRRRTFARGNSRHLLEDFRVCHLFHVSEHSAADCQRIIVLL